MSELAERVYPMHSETHILTSLYPPSPSLSEPSVPSSWPLCRRLFDLGPFSITVHRPGRLPIMSLYPRKRMLLRRTINRDSSNFKYGYLRIYNSHGRFLRILTELIH